jgi:hypothetical protein
VVGDSFNFGECGLEGAIKWLYGAAPQFNFVSGRDGWYCVSGGSIFGLCGGGDGTVERMYRRSWI